ncbi:MAG: phosphotransferase [Bacteroidales bacterium]|nr:phosphotransferase [Bacteroidales bacterium]
MEQLKALFRQWAGEPCTQCLALGANGSSRRYYRLVGDTHRCIGAIASDVRENEAFFAYSRHLLARGIRVPELYAVDDDRIHYLQQDLGDQTLYGLLYEKKQKGGGFDAEMLALYRQALADLHDIQVAGRDMDFSIAYPRPAFDTRSILWDLNYFKYNYLKLQHIPFDEDRLEDDFQRLADTLLSADTNYFLYRDFNPRNIMVAESEKCEAINEKHDTRSEKCALHTSHLSLHTSHFTPPALYYIDYQGGRRGAAQYDVASLLFSAKSDLPQAIRNDLLQHYVALHGDPHFMDHFWHYVLLRILQTLGAYGYRGIFERKPYFIESIPLAHNNLRHLVEDHPDLLADLPELQSIVGNLELVVKSDDLGDRSHGAGVENATTLNSQLTVTVMSFSYKQGLPDDPSGNGGGHVFDCRALPNPGRYPEYKAYTGKDAPVIEFLRDKQPVAIFLDHALAIVTQSVDKYLERHFTHLSVSFGCTGGQHRSVYCAEQLAKALRSRYPDVNVVLHHREQQ